MQFSCGLWMLKFECVETNQSVCNCYYFIALKQTALSIHDYCAHIPDIWAGCTLILCFLLSLRQYHISVRDLTFTEKYAPCFLKWFNKCHHINNNVNHSFIVLVTAKHFFNAVSSHNDFPNGHLHWASHCDSANYHWIVGKCSFGSGCELSWCVWDGSPVFMRAHMLIHMLIHAAVKAKMERCTRH